MNFYYCMTKKLTKWTIFKYIQYFGTRIFVILSKQEKYDKKWKYALNFSNVSQYGHSQSEKSEDFVTNTTAASKYIPKGQSISEQIYEVIVSPKIRTKYFKDFCPSL